MTTVRMTTSTASRDIRRGRRACIVGLVVLLLGSLCLAQSNDVFSFWTSPSTPLTGYRLAVIHTSPIWTAGSAGNQFGIEKCSYWTDATGAAIPWPANRVKQPGDTQHCYTRFRLGQVSISMPLPPVDLAVFVAIVALVSACLATARIIRQRERANDPPLNL